MRLTIFGSGYVGLVSGACLAETGNHVVCVDIDADKIARLNNGEIPIYEPGLDAYIERNVEAGRLEFTTDVQKGVNHGLFQFISVGTPPDEDGSADLKHVVAVAKSIGEHMNEYRIVVDKSTVPVGTADMVKAWDEGNIDRARELFYKLFPLCQAMFYETNPIPVKTSLAMMGKIGEEMRLPLVPMSAANRERLKKALEEYGLIP